MTTVAFAAIRLSRVEENPERFVQAVRQYGDISILDDDGGHLVLAHHVENFRQACDAVQRSFVQGFCPKPGTFPYAASPADRYLSNIYKNIAGLVKFPASITILTKDGVPIMVLQNFIRDLAAFNSEAISVDARMLLGSSDPTVVKVAQALLTMLEYAR